MEETNNQPIFEEPEYVTKSITLKPFHKKILDTIDENTSNAIRKVIEEYYKHNQIINRDKIILDFCLGMLLIGVAISVPLWYESLVFYGIGIGCIVYGIFYYVENRRKRML